MLYRTLSGLVCVVLMAAAGYAQTADPQIVAPIQRFIDAFNKGDVPGAAATHAAEADLAIVDEVAPFMWTGAKAFQTWATDLDSDAKKNGITDPKVTLSRPSRVESNGTAAYVVVPVVYTFKQKGAAMREAAQMTFALKKGASGWLIHGWAWTGSRAQAASGAVKK